MGCEDRGVVRGRAERELLWEREGVFHGEGVAVVAIAGPEVWGCTWYV